MPLSLKTPSTPGWEAATARFRLMMMNDSHEPRGEGSWDGVLGHTDATLLREDLWLFCFVYLSVSILTVI